MMRWLVVLVMAFSVTTALAKVETYEFDDPEQAARYKILIQELRCLVCQNQNLADSNAELAQDLRRQTYEMVSKGSTVDEVVDYMVQRYGDFVLYRPPFKLSTALLWIGPFVILGGGVLILIVVIRQKKREPQPKINSADFDRAKRLLEKEDNPL
jgi:cytochrome c-type biogenesis protein CcmH